MSDPLYVLDASALLCAILDEPGANTVAALLDDSIISAVNLSEVVAKLHERDFPPDVISHSLAGLDLKVRALDEDQALLAGDLWLSTRSAGLSFGDRACLALAMRTRATAVTTDHAWAKVEGVPVTFARSAPTRP